MVSVRAEPACDSTKFRASMTTLNQPLLPDVGVLALVADPWSMVWQPRHYVLSRLAKFFRVVWVEPAQEWREMLASPRVFTSREEVVSPYPGFSVYRSQPWFPKLHRPGWLADLSFQQRLKRARGWLTGAGCQKIILYIWRPEFAHALQAIPFDLSCYHVDDEYSFSPVELPIPEEEARLLEQVDQVFIHSLALLKKKGKINPHTSFVPNGVDYKAYAQPVAEPADLAAIPHPRIGYSGYLKKQLDWPLVVRLAARHPDWSFVFVGAQNNPEEIRPFLQELSRRGNVHFLGAKLTPILSAYPQHFDVCIMPYRADDYTRYIYPLKLHEYLASGRPTVGTRIPSLAEFAEVVALPRTDEEWSAAIADALGADANQESRQSARQAVARLHDWSFLVLQIAHTMAQVLGKSYADRLVESVGIGAELPTSVHR